MPEKEQTFHVEGMHCESCVLFVEEKLKGRAGIVSAKADAETHEVVVKGNIKDDSDTLLLELNQEIKDAGYRLVRKESKERSRYRDFLIALPAALTVIIAFALLQQLGLVHFVNAAQVTYGTAILLGLIASVSTCLVVVGGLVLSLSATAAKTHGRGRSQIMFHFGRLGGFFVLGGVVGSVGRLFEFGLLGSGILSACVAAIMLILGINLLDIFPAVKKLQIKPPQALSRLTIRTSNSQSIFAPLVVGIGTFFLPCGFTQSMQAYALTTGSFIVGGLTMLFFALGTLPVLGLLSLGVFEFSHKPWKGVFFKASGIVIIALSLFNLWNALHVLNLV